MARQRVYVLIAVDVGNGNIKIKTPYGEVTIPHALHRLSASELNELEARGRLEADNDLWEVNGVYYYVGDKAMKSGSGAVLYGENRYKWDYYGVLVAIATAQAMPKSANNIFLYGGHTPKDIDYRPDLIHAVTSIPVWQVKHKGEMKSFTYLKARGYEETVSIYRNATMSDDGMKLTSGWLRAGRCLILDFGAFTIGVSVAIDGRIDYGASRSFKYGVLNVLDELARLIRRNNKTLLKGSQVLDPMRVRRALVDPAKGYDAGGHGYIPCVTEADHAKGAFVRELSSVFQQFGGVSDNHSVLIGGGGAAVMYDEIRETLNHKNTYLAEPDFKVIQLAGVRGAMKVLKRLEASNKLDADMD